jgi:acyl-CoA synthetase (NDP forming)
MFAPETIAPIVATEAAGSVGRVLLENLKSYHGPVYPGQSEATSSTTSQTIGIPLASLFTWSQLVTPAPFFSAAREVALTKPIIVLKVGRATLGAKAVTSHTGAPA